MNHHLIFGTWQGCQQAFPIAKILCIQETSFGCKIEMDGERKGVTFNTEIPYAQIVNEYNLKMALAKPNNACGRGL